MADLHPDANLFRQQFPTIRVEVQCYDNTHKHVLEKTLGHDRVVAITSNPVEIATADFLSYYLFHLQPRDPYSTYTGCAKRAAKAVHEIEDILAHNGVSIQIPEGYPKPPVYVVEHTGEALGLSVINELYDLHEADWTKVEPKRGRGAPKSLDFILASDGAEFIELETKGRTTESNETTDGLDGAASDIAAKKAAQRNLDGALRAARFGTIVALDSQPESVAKCWLLDPPVPTSETDPRSFRLMARMEFLRDLISTVARRTQLAATLATRCAELPALGDPFELSGSTLRAGTGEPIFYDTPTGSTHSTFFGVRARVEGINGGGILERIDGGNLLLYGLRHEVLDLAAEQDFERILKYRFDPFTETREVECIVGEGRFKRLGIGNLVGAKIANGYAHFTLRGVIQGSSAGRVFGVLPLE